MSPTNCSGVLRSSSMKPAVEYSPVTVAIEAAKQHVLVLALAEQIVDRCPLQARPPLRIVGWANYYDDEVRLFVIKFRQIDTEITTSEFRFVEFVVEDRVLAEAVC